ncbi:MAG: ATP-binding protein [Methanomassiliicoccales archaeon]|nr:ATP-binding protein [Methanomassiliicoccales archaeon]
MANFDAGFHIDALTAVSAIVIVITTIVIALCYLTMTGSKNRFRLAFIALMLSEETIAIGYMMGVVAESLELKYFCNLIEYLGYLGAPVFFLIFVLLYTHSKFATKRSISLLFIAPIAFMVIIATNYHHHLYYYVTDDPQGPFSTFYAENGPLFVVFGIYTLMMIVTVIFILARYYLRMPKAYKTGVMFVMSYALISLTSVLLYYISGEVVPSGLVITTGLIIGSIPLFIGASRFELFQVLPFANRELMDNMQDSVIVLDENDNVLFINKTAEKLTGANLEGAHRHHVSRILPLFPVGSFVLSDDEASSPISNLKVGDRHYELTLTPIKKANKAPLGKLVLIRDVTPTKQAEEEARRANETLEILNGFTRHDIKNQLMVLEGHLSLIQLKSTEPVLARHIAAAMTSGHNISKQLQLAYEYQELGKRAETWQSLQTVCVNVQRLINIGEVKLVLNTGDAMILADPLFSNVIVNLVTNSLMHGENVTVITITASEFEDHLEIIYQDNGVGIVDDYKRIIFEKGVGKNTGLGLHLVRMILDIGGMSIIEDGVAGEGVRFRISVPIGKYRLPDKR